MNPVQKQDLISKPKKNFLNHIGYIWCLDQGLVKGARLCLNPYFLAGWRSELAGCRSTRSLSKIKVKISETKYHSFIRP